MLAVESFKRTYLDREDEDEYANYLSAGKESRAMPQKLIDYNVFGDYKQISHKIDSFEKIAMPNPFPSEGF